MIEFDQVGVTYDGHGQAVLAGVSLHVREGDFCLVVGPTGAGKSTLLGTVNGLVPHFTGGHLAGRVTVAGRDTRTHRPRDLADIVGVVGQDPRAGFVTDTVEDELAYTMESLALPHDVMRRRIEDTLDLLGLVELRERSLSSLSGGQAQRVAIGSVLTAHPRVLVLDEPTSALDPAAAEEVLAALQRLVHDLGLTVLIAEHRLERVIQYADSVIWLPGGGAAVVHDNPERIMAEAPIGPPVVELARLAGWPGPPLTVRDGRRAAAGLRAQLPATPRPRATSSAGVGAGATAVAMSGLTAGTEAGTPVAQVSKLSVRYGEVEALRAVDLVLSRGQIVALMGRNGAGKSTLFAALTGLVRPLTGRVRLGTDLDPRRLKPAELLRWVGLVPQQPADLLYGETVAAECRTADAESSIPAGSTAAILARIGGQIDPGRHPRDLSEGQRLCLALAVVLGASPPLLLLDEPTRGLDYAAKARLVAALWELRDAGHAIVLATHDVELAAELSDRTVVLADGVVVADGPSRDVVTQSPIFAPQVAKVLAPLPYLTVADVRRTLAAS